MELFICNDTHDPKKSGDLSVYRSLDDLLYELEPEYNIDDPALNYFDTSGYRYKLVREKNGEYRFQKGVKDLELAKSIVKDFFERISKDYADSATLTENASKLLFESPRIGIFDSVKNWVKSKFS